MNVEEYLNQLNESQREAVVYNEGPSLVVAGAGSGKTRVLTYKIAYLLQLGLPPYSILALTFTNKAAREMKERIAAITGDQTARRLWMGTFHSIFSRILRNEAEHIGYPSNFTIYDATDSKSLLKSIIKEMQLDDKVYRLGMVQSRISNAKNSLITYTAYEQNKELVESDMNAKVPLLREIYKRYQSRCLQAGAMDFDDLLLQTNILFRDHPAVLEKYRNFFRYVLVDEYQDTNFAQHLIVQRLCERHGHICVVGDDAQSIYSFRGANIDNILQFKNLYTGCRIFKLERNYRSTQNILDAANSVIANNDGRKSKHLWTDAGAGEKITWYKAADESDESAYVSKKILENVKQGAKYGDHAILYRMNAQSNMLERALVRSGVPYRIYGGTRFYDRKEIRDIIAYMSIVENPNDRVRFERIVNEPKRGIGDATLSLLQDITQDLHLSPLEVMRNADQYPVLSKKMNALKKFAVMWDELIEAERELPLEKFLDVVLEKTGYRAALEQMGEEGTFRLENVEELKSSILTYQNEAEEPSLGGFLEEISLYTDVDKYEPEQDVVMLMTVHSAKGLEFQNVFLVGMEQGVFPGNRSLDSREDLEEERRLAYVALTRAKKKLTLTTAASRMLFGMTMRNLPSQFLTEIDRQLIEQEASQRQSRRGISADKPESVQSISLQRQMASAKPQKYKAEPKEFHVGERVRHATFGDGTVLAITKMANDAMLEVGFDQVGTKRLMASHPKIKKLL